MASNPKIGDSYWSDKLNHPMGGERQTAIADHSFVYTTDDPGLTAASATTIADGDAALVVLEFHQTVTDLSGKINAIIAVLEAHGLIADA